LGRGVRGGAVLPNLPAEIAIGGREPRGSDR